MPGTGKKKKHFSGIGLDLQHLTATHLLIEKIRRLHTVETISFHIFSLLPFFPLVNYPILKTSFLLPPPKPTIDFAVSVKRNMHSCNAVSWQLLNFQYKTLGYVHKKQSK